LKQKYLTKILIPLTLSVLVIAFFHALLFSGQTILGIDGNYGIHHAIGQALNSNIYAWWRTIWLGSANAFSVNTHVLFLKLFSTSTALAYYLCFTFLTALSFMFLLLRRYKINSCAALFGAIAYAFTPHFITLIYPMHGGPITVVAYIPMLFYFLTITFDETKSSRLKTWISVIMSGFAWGMVMNEDPQRGLYVSVTAAAYTLYLLWSFIPLKSARKNLFRQTGRVFMRIAPIGIIFFLTFYNSLQSQLGGKNLATSPATAQEDAEEREKQKWAFSTSWSLDPKELADSLAPGFHGCISGDDEKPYWGSRPIAHSSDALGFFVVLFALVGIATGLRKEKHSRFFLAAATLATLLAFGSFMPGKPLFWLWYHLPMMDKFRAPVKFMCVTTFSLAILASYGLQNLMNALREDSRLPRHLQKALSAMLIITIIWLFSLTGGKDVLRHETFSGKLGGNPALMNAAFSTSFGAVIKMNFYIVLSLITLWLARRFKKLPRITAITACAFTLLLVFDLFSTDQFYLRKSLFKPGEFFVADDVIKKIKADKTPARVTTSIKIVPGERMVPLALTVTGNRYTTFLFPYFQIEAMDRPPQRKIAGDYTSLFSAMLSGIPQTQNPEAFVTSLLDKNLRFWQLCNVRYVITDGGLRGISTRPLSVMTAFNKHPKLKLLGVYNGCANRQQAIFEVLDTLPRFAFYSSWKTVAENKCALELISDIKFDFSNTAVVTADRESRSSDKTGIKFIEPKILEYSDVYSKLAINTADDGLLVMNSRHDKNWKAKIDGVDAEINPANFIMSGVFVPKGKHTVEFIFSPSTINLRISMVTICIVLITSISLAIVQLFIPAKTGTADEQ